MHKDSTSIPYKATDTKLRETLTRVNPNADLLVQFQTMLVQKQFADAIEVWEILITCVSSLTLQQASDFLLGTLPLVEYRLLNQELDKAEQFYIKIKNATQDIVLSPDTLYEFHVQLADIYLKYTHYSLALDYFTVASRIQAQTLDKSYLHNNLTKIEILSSGQITISYLLWELKARDIEKLENEIICKWLTLVSEVASTYVSICEWQKVAELYTNFAPLVNRFIVILGDDLHKARQQSLVAFKAVVDKSTPVIEQLILYQINDKALEALKVIINNANREAATFDKKGILSKIVHINDVKLGKKPAKNLPYFSLWSINRNRLSKSREEFNGKIDNYLSFTQAQTKFVTEVIKLLADMAKECVKRLGDPVCPFSLAILGSYSRKTAVRYSDLDCIILIADEKQREHAYFKHFIQLYKLMIDLLGENVQPGLRIDSGDMGHFLNKQGDLINTPEGFIARFNPATISVEQPEPYAIHRPSLVYASSNGEKLLNIYFELLHDKFEFYRQFSQDPDKNLWPQYQKLGFHYLLEHRRQYATEIKQIAKTPLLNLKKRYISPLMLWLTDIALFYGIRAVTLVDIIDELQAKGFIDINFLNRCKKAILQTQLVRNQAHLLSGWQNDNVCTHQTTAGNYLMLSQAQCAELNSIERNVLYPMYESVPRLKLTPSTGFDPVFEELSQQLEQYAVVSTKHRSELKPLEQQINDAIDSIINNALIEKVPLLSHRRYFKQLPIYFRTYYIYKLRQLLSEQSGRNLNVDYGTKLLDFIENFPTENGARRGYSKKTKDWENTFLQLYTESYDENFKATYKTNRRMMLETIIDGKCVKKLLRIEVQNQIFNADGSLMESKRKDLDGRRLVIAIRDQENKVIGYAKVFPEAPGMQIAVDILTGQISGLGLSANIVQITNLTNSNVYCILISQPVIGTNLQDAIRQNILAEIDKKLDSYTFTLKIFEEILLRYEDNKADNLVAVASKNLQGEDCFQIVGVDSDHVFVEPVLQSGTFLAQKEKVQVKSLIFCMNAMSRSLDRFAVEDFLVLDPYSVLNDWLLKLQLLNSRYIGNTRSTGTEYIFQMENLKTWSEQKEFCFVPIAFEPGVLTKIYNNFIRLQAVLRHTELPKNHLELLSFIEPRLASHYEKVFDKFNSPELRFQALPTDYTAVEEKNTKTLRYQSTFDVKKRILVSMTQVDENKQKNIKKLLEDGRIYGPSQALEELTKAHGYQSLLASIRADILKGNLASFRSLGKDSDALKEKIINSIDFSKIPAIQDEILKDLVNIQFNQLSLLNCQSLTDAILGKILENSEDLTSLSIFGCNSLTEEFIKFLEKLHYLEKLAISNLIKLQVMSFRSDPKNRVFAKLRHLQINDCMITTLDIDLRSLKFLDLRNNPMLSMLKISAEELLAVNLTGCQKIPETMLKSIIKNCYFLDVVTSPSGAETRRDITKSLKLGEEDLLRGSLTSALKLHQAVLNKDPKNILALLEKSFILQYLGKHDAALGAFCFCLNLLSLPDFIALINKNLEQAKRRYLAPAQQSDSNYFHLMVSLQIGLARLYLVSAQYSKSDQYFREVIALVKETKLKGIAKGMALLAIGDYYFFEYNKVRDAIEYYLASLVELDSVKSFGDEVYRAVQKKLARAYLKQKDFKMAIVYYDTTLNLINSPDQKLKILKKLVKVHAEAGNINKMLGVCEDINFILANFDVNSKDVKLSNYVKLAVKQSLANDGNEVLEMQQKILDLLLQNIKPVKDNKDKTKNEEFISAFGEIAELIKGKMHYILARTFFEYYIRLYKEHNKELASNYYDKLNALATCYENIRDYQQAIKLCKETLDFYCKDQEKYEVKIIKTMLLQSRLLKLDHKYAAAEETLFDLLERLDRFIAREQNIEPFEMAKRNLTTFSEELGLAELEYDDNNTCILGIDDDFSLHLTYEANSKSLYLYAPLLDGLPKDKGDLLKLFVMLLEGSMLGGQFQRGGVGVAMKEELLLAHATLDMRLADRYTLSEIAPDYIEMIEYWRARCNQINVKRVPRKQAEDVCHVASFSLHMKQKVLELLSELSKQYPLRANLPPSTTQLFLAQAKQQLQDFATSLNLNGIEYNEENTCILGIDDEFSLHITFRPEAGCIYMYSSLLDGFPKDQQKLLELYQKLLEAAMLGGKVAGGGAGIASTEEMILMHHCIYLNPYVNNQNASLRTVTNFAPLYVEVVERLRKEYAPYALIKQKSSSRFLISGDVLRKRFGSIFNLFSMEKFLASFSTKNIVKSDAIKKHAKEKFAKMAKELYDAKQFVDCIEYSNYVLAIEPSNMEMARYNALSHHCLNNYEEAIERYLYLLEADPKEKKILSNIAYCYSNLTNYAEAKRYFILIIALDAENADAYSGLADTCCKMGEYGEALSRINKALALDKKANYLCVKSYIYRVQERYAEAIDYLTQAMELDPKVSWYPQSLASMFSKQGYFNKAIEYYDRAIAIDPLNINAHDNKAYCYHKLGKNDLAEEFYMKALSLPPSAETAYVLYNIGFCLKLGTGKYYEGLAYIEKAHTYPLKKDKYPYIYITSAAIYCKMGQFNKAKQLVITALNHTKDNDSKILCLEVQMEILLDCSDYTNLLRVANESLAIKPLDNMGAQRHKAIALAYLNKKSEAEKLLTELLNKLPDSAFILRTAGIIRMCNKEYPQALHYFNAYLAINPVDPDTLIYISQLHNLMGKKQEALAAIEVGLKVNPNHFKLREYKNQLLGLQVRKLATESTNSEHMAVNEEIAQRLPLVGIDIENETSNDDAEFSLRNFRYSNQPAIQVRRVGNRLQAAQVIDKAINSDTENNNSETKQSSKAGRQTAASSLPTSSEQKSSDGTGFVLPQKSSPTPPLLKQATKAPSLLASSHRAPIKHDLFGKSSSSDLPLKHDIPLEEGDLPVAKPAIKSEQVTVLPPVPRRPQPKIPQAAQTIPTKPVTLTSLKPQPLTNSHANVSQSEPNLAQDSAHNTLLRALPEPPARLLPKQRAVLTEEIEGNSVDMRARVTHAGVLVLPPNRLAPTLQQSTADNPSPLKNAAKATAFFKSPGTISEKAEQDVIKSKSARP